MSEIRASRSQDKFIIRLPDGMREKLAMRAKINRRSMNAEAVAILERSLHDPGAVAASALANEYRQVVRELQNNVEVRRMLESRLDELRKLFDELRLGERFTLEADKTDDTPR